MKTLYKRNGKGQPIEWSISKTDHNLKISHGLVGGKLHVECIPITMAKTNEAEARYKAKLKEGYKLIDELRDDSPPVEKMDDKAIIDYLNAYLPINNTTDTGFVLPMLAKTLEDNKPFEKFGSLLGQYKINGLRCIVGAEKSSDMFEPIRFTFTSREGTRWDLNWLGYYLLRAIDEKLLDLMVEEGVCLDGELYVPGCSVNLINHYVKDKNSEGHKRLQYWCYDLCVPDVTAINRNLSRISNIAGFMPTTKWEHLNNAAPIVLLPTVQIESIPQAIEYRNKYIDMGYEGLILRNPYAEYQFGKRNTAMYKFKKVLDGLFEVMLIKEDKRGLPIYTLKNDINDELFECTINLPQDKQREQLQIKEYLIGKRAFVEFRERSGVKGVPFHAKIIKIIL